MPIFLVAKKPLHFILIIVYILDLDLFLLLIFFIGAFLQQKMRIKLSVNSEKCRKKAMQVAVVANG